MTPCGCFNCSQHNQSSATKYLKEDGMGTERPLNRKKAEARQVALGKYVNWPHSRVISDGVDTVVVMETTKFGRIFGHAFLHVDAGDEYSQELGENLALDRAYKELAKRVKTANAINTYLRGVR